MTKTVEEKEAYVAGILCEELKMAHRKWSPLVRHFHPVCLERSNFMISLYTDDNTAEANIDEVEAFLLGFQGKRIISSLCSFSKEEYEYLQELLGQTTDGAFQRFALKKRTYAQYGFAPVPEMVLPIPDMHQKRIDEFNQWYKSLYSKGRFVKKNPQGREYELDRWLFWPAEDALEKLQELREQLLTPRVLPLDTAIPQKSEQPSYTTEPGHGDVNIGVTIKNKEYAIVGSNLSSPNSSVDSSGTFDLQNG
jgi:hypothetical protein